MVRVAAEPASDDQAERENLTLEQVIANYAIE
jgi:hypothetical protein